VLVIDKGRGVGGRLATRRIGGATFDHGAQFLTARVPRFKGLLEEMQEAGAVVEWYGIQVKGSAPDRRWRGAPTMTAIAKHLARDLSLLLGKRVAALRCEGPGWVAALESGETLSAGAVVLTAPIPQALAVLEAGRSELPEGMKERLEKIEYERCFAVMAVPNGPARIPRPGGVAPQGGPIAWIADNHLKGVSSSPAVTIHATADFSLRHWERDRMEVGRELIKAARDWLGSVVTEFQVHGWRYSRPLMVEASPYLRVSDSPPLLLAGDVFGGPRVEGAALSGWAAADALLAE
jgi:predicted NAD/FAD-dependent oxidoreductase